jgi:hypothetical protein
MSDVDAILNNEQPQEIVATPEEAAPIEAIEPEAPIEAAEQEAPVEQPAVEPEVKEPTMVPVSALQKVRQELQELKAQQVAAPPVEVPDVFEDQTAYTGHIQNQIQKATAQVRADMSEDMAVSQHGKEVVDAAFEAMKATGDQQLAQQFMAQKMPYHALVNWHKQQQVVQEVGNDPAAWREAQRAEILKELQAEMAVKSAQDMAATAAPSMANVTGTGGSPKTQWAGPPSIDSILR